MIKYETFYLAAIPPTVISIVEYGRLPEKMPNYYQTSEMVFYERPSESIKDLARLINLNSIFILKCEFGNIDDNPAITKIKLEGINDIVLRATQIDSNCVKEIFVKQLSTQKLAENLFNRKCPLKIEIRSDMFQLEKKATVQYVPTKYNVFQPLPEQPFRYMKKGDLLGSKAHVLVNTVNCVGIMGKGIAFAFKQRFPKMFKEYAEKCKKKEVKTGEPYLYKESDNVWVLNFPTKNHWKNPSKLDWIESGLKYLSERITEWKIKSIAFPPLGCGNGGLEWNAVKPLIEKYLKNCDIPVEIYEPFTREKNNNNTNEFPHKDKKTRSTQGSIMFNNK